MEKFFEKMWEFLGDILPNFIVAVLILVIGYFVTKLILKISKKGMNKANMDYSLEKFFLNCIRVICYILLIISALSQMGISTTGIIACFSAGAAAIALALKDSLANIASGIILLFSRPFVTDDIIEINDERGSVAQIDLMHTKIVTFDNRCITIPNSLISSMEVINYSAQPQRRIDITVPVDYSSDIELVKKVLMDTAKDNKLVLSKPEEPFIRVNSFSQSSVDVVVRVWVNSEDYWQVYHDMMESIMINLNKNKINIPFNQLDVHLVK